MYQMIPTIFPNQYGYGSRGRTLEAQFTSSHDKLLREADDMADSRAWKQIDTERAKWSAMLPTKIADLLPWLLQQSDDVTSNLFAYCVAATLDSVSGTDSAHPVNALCDVLNLDMTKYWTATQASYLNHVSKGRISEVVTAAAVSADAAAPLAANKKNEAALMAERLLSETGWLPEVLLNRDLPQDFSCQAAEPEEFESDEDVCEEDTGADGGQ